MKRSQFYYPAIIWLSELSKDRLEGFIELLPVLESTGFTVVIDKDYFLYHKIGNPEIYVLVNYDRGFDVPTDNPQHLFMEHIKQIAETVTEVDNPDRKTKSRITFTIKTAPFTIHWMKKGTQEVYNTAILFKRT